jgi:uncharacterized membrane protein
MAQTARRPAPSPDDPPIDPTAVEHAYRVHRARRRARIERRRERSRARLRFLVASTILVALAIVLILALWHEIQHVFGL